MTVALALRTRFLPEADELAALLQEKGLTVLRRSVTEAAGLGGITQPDHLVEVPEQDAAAAAEIVAAWRAAQDSAPEPDDEPEPVETDAERAVLGQWRVGARLALVTTVVVVVAGTVLGRLDVFSAGVSAVVDVLIYNRFSVDEPARRKANVRLFALLRAGIGLILAVAAAWPKPSVLLIGLAAGRLVSLVLLARGLPRPAEPAPPPA